MTCNKCKTHTKTDEVTVSKKCPKCNATNFFLSKTEKKRIDLLISKISALAADIKKREEREVAKQEKPLLDLKKKISKTEKLWHKAKMSIKTSLKTSGFTTCKSCSSNINMGKIESEEKDDCPVCGRWGLQKQSNGVAERNEFKYKADLIPLYQKLSAMTGEYWIVGGATKA